MLKNICILRACRAYFPMVMSRDSKLNNERIVFNSLDYYRTNDFIGIINPQKGLRSFFGTM